MFTVPFTGSPTVPKLMANFNNDIEILYQDKHMLLVNKPTGLHCVSVNDPVNNDSVYQRIVQEFPSATLVHRLDQGASGIMALALSSDVNVNLMRQFRARTVLNTYTAVLQGHVDSDEGYIDLPIVKSTPNRPHLEVCYTNGKQALTHYLVVHRTGTQPSDPAMTKVVFYAQTGRTHQLRLHAREFGHPILGCGIYGSGNSQKMADRLMLHATTLEIDHPITGERIIGECPCPF